MRASLHLSVIALSCLTFSIACSSGDEEKEKGLTFAMVPKTSNNLVFAMGNEGAQVAASDLTASSGRNVTVQYLASEELDADVEAANVRKAIADGVDGLLVSCLDASLSGPVDEAVAAGIPVITFDSDCPDSQRLGFYSMQSEDTGSRGADLLVSSMGSGAKTVAILTGRAGADNLERRVKGFQDRLAAEYPDVEVVSVANCEETGASCGAVLEDQLMTDFPDLDGLFIVGLWGIADGCTCDATATQCSCEDTQLPKWKTAGKGKLKTVSYDTLPFELELMKQGYVSALLGQKYFGWGYDTVSMMFDHIVAGRAVDTFIDSGFDVVCPNNVDDMASKWEAKDFRRELSPACDL